MLSFLLGSYPIRFDLLPLSVLYLLVELERANDFQLSDHSGQNCRLPQSRPS